MIEIKLSEVKALPFDFEAEVQAFIAALKAHQGVEMEAAPTAHPLVTSAVDRVQYPIEDEKPDEFVAAYTIVDDTPPPLPEPLPTLDERKAELVHVAQQQAHAAIARVQPPLKAKLWQMDAAAAFQVEEAKRTPEQIAIIAAHNERHAKINAIQYRLAQIESDVHDLTEATIDQFKPQPFPGI